MTLHTGPNPQLIIFKQTGFVSLHPRGFLEKKNPPAQHANSKMILLGNVL